MIALPTVGVKEKLPVMRRKPCFLDSLDLAQLRLVNAKLHKKATIAFTKWAIWSPIQFGWTGKPCVVLSMFEADRLTGYRDTRVWDQGRLVGLHTFMKGTSNRKSYR